VVKIKKLHNWGGSSHLLDVAIWEQYGYWHSDKKQKKIYPMPEWYEKEKEILNKVIAIVKEPNTVMSIKYHKNKDSGSYEFKDTNNKWMESWKVNAGGFKSKEKFERYVQERFNKLKYLHDGVINALLVYKNTGIACRPDWNNNSIDSYGYQLVDGKIKTNYVPKVSKVLYGSYKMRSY